MLKLVKNIANSRRNIKQDQDVSHH